MTITNDTNTVATTRYFCERGWTLSRTNSAYLIFTIDNGERRQIMVTNHNGVIYDESSFGLGPVGAAAFDAALDAVANLPHF